MNGQSDNSVFLKWRVSLLGISLFVLFIHHSERDQLDSIQKSPHQRVLAVDNSTLIVESAHPVINNSYLTGFSLLGSINSGSIRVFCSKSIVNQSIRFYKNHFLEIKPYIVIGTFRIRASLNSEDIPIS